MQKILEESEDLYIKNNNYENDYYDDDETESDTPEEIQAIDLLGNLNIQSIEDFRCDASSLARYYIKLFFNNKKPLDSSLSEDYLLSVEKIYTVVNTSIILGVQKAYTALEKCFVITQEDLNKAKKNGDVTEEIRLVNETLKSLYESGVPQQFAGGMMMLYLEYCRGVDFGS